MTVISPGKSPANTGSPANLVTLPLRARVKEVTHIGGIAGIAGGMGCPELAGRSFEEGGGATVRSTTTAAANVVAGWLGIAIPPMPRQRNATRAGYRKTVRRAA